MFEKMKEILDERVKTADNNPFYCPTCNAPRFSADVVCLEDDYTLICKHCNASLCTVVEGPDHSFSLSESPVPQGDMFFSPNRTMP